MKNFEPLPDEKVTALPLILLIGGSPGVLLLLIYPELSLQTWLLVFVRSIGFPQSWQVLVD
jgi:hypothetical protein